MEVLVGKPKVHLTVNLMNRNMVMSLICCEIVVGGRYVDDIVKIIHNNVSYIMVVPYPMYCQFRPFDRYRYDTDLVN